MFLPACYPPCLIVLNQTSMLEPLYPVCALPPSPPKPYHHLCLSPTSLPGSYSLSAWALPPCLSLIPSIPEPYLLTWALPPTSPSIPTWAIPPYWALPPYLSPTSAINPCLVPPCLPQPCLFPCLSLPSIPKPYFLPAWTLPPRPSSSSLPESYLSFQALPPYLNPPPCLSSSSLRETTDWCISVDVQADVYFYMLSYHWPLHRQSLGYLLSNPQLFHHS